MRLTPSIVCALFGLLLGGPGFAAEPLLRPAPDAASWKKIFDSFKAPAPPRHLVGNIYYVGASGVSAYLVATPEGHILIDTGFADTVPLIQHSVEQLGFKVGDIKFILSSHAHIDHTGGHALMKQLTHATVCASAADAGVLESGGAADFIPGPKEVTTYTPVKVDRIVADDERIVLGGAVLTAHLTPGHTRGATTWTMDATENGRTYHVVFFCSLTINPGVRLVREASYPGIVTDYESTLAKLRALPCDIFFAPHGAQFGMADKFARLDRGEGAAALVDPAGWRALLDANEKAFRDQLAAERAVTP